MSGKYFCYGARHSSRAWWLTLILMSVASQTGATTLYFNGDAVDGRVMYIY